MQSKKSELRPDREGRARNTPALDLALVEDMRKFLKEKPRTRRELMHFTRMSEKTVERWLAYLSTYFRKGWRLKSKRFGEGDGRTRYWLE
jgi:hypothetical protein